jgi:GntR family transcriptional regulator/MocR family aminotransferase
MVRIPLERGSAVPVYRQIEQFLWDQIQGGALSPHTKLPSTRQLADDLGVSRIIVANAYAELESEGLVYGKRGSGTYVGPTYLVEKTQGFAAPQDWPLWQQELLSNTWQPTSRELARLLASVAHLKPISFAEHLGFDPLWPADDFRKALQSVLRREGPAAAGQGDNMAGYLPLRVTVAEILSTEGIPTQADNVVITSGSQQALNLVADLLLSHGDVVLVESPTYNVAIDLFRARGVRLLGIPVDQDGMQVHRVEEALRTARPRMLFTMPTFQNPSGTCMSGVRRRQLIALADRYNVPILEDDFVGNLRYEGRAEPALKAMDPGGRVIYTGTFSKVLMPGLRIGFLVANGPVYERLMESKYIADLATSDMMQRALNEYITVGRFHAHLRRVCQTNRPRRDAMVDALARRLPSETRWLYPKGGRSIWVQLPGGLSANELFPLAAEEGVTFVPGSFFFPGERPQGYLRLNFALNPPEVIEEGAKRLGRAVDRLMRTRASRPAKPSQA